MESFDKCFEKQIAVNNIGVAVLDYLEFTKYFELLKRPLQKIERNL